MYNSLRFFLFCLLFSLYFVSVQSVDRGRFKTCGRSGFCTRNRQYAGLEEVLSPYDVVEGSITRAPARVMADLIQKENGEKFLLVLTNYKNNIVRVKITEKAPMHKRYNVGGVILSDIEKEASSTDSTLIFDKVQIIESPFELRFFSDPSTEVLRANSRGLFNVEHYREKPEDKEEENSEEKQAEVTEEEKQKSPYRQMNDYELWSEKFQSHTDSKPRGPSSVAMDFSFLESNHVYGIPEHASSFSLKDTKDTDPYRLYNLDVFEYELDETMALYGSIPLMISTQADKGTSSAVFWLNAAETWVDIDHKDESQVDTHWFSESGALEFFVLLGPTPKDIFKQYAYLTGTQELPPLFSIAYHQCRWNYKDQDDVAMVDRMFDEYDIPYDVLWLDIEHTEDKKYFTWDSNKFPQPKEMLDSLASKGRHMVTIVDPHIKRASGYSVFDGGNDLDLWVKQSDGVSTYEGHCWPGASSYLDFSSEKTRKYWSEHFQYEKYEHSTPDLFIWNDMNEPSVFNGPEVTMQKDLIHEGNIEHRDLHNQFGAWVHQATHEGLVARDSDSHRSFVLSRAFFAGSQKYGAIWTGDNGADWGHLKASVPMLLSISVTGISFCGADVGGFFGNPNEELLIRWYQAGAYQPFFRAHAHLDTKRREPYLYSPETSGLIRQAIRSRYSLLPYWYTCFYQASSSGIPVMRPLWVEYPHDSHSYDIEDSYLIGSDLLVKPVTSADQDTVSVYFPEGSSGWFDVVSYDFYPSSGFVDVDAPLSKIPVYQRAGSIVPRKERARRSSSQMTNDPYTLVIALDSNGEAEGELYFDDGVSFEYQNTAKNHRRFVFKNNQILSYSIGSSFYESSVVIERIVILGSKQIFTKAKTSQQGFALSADVLSQTSANGQNILVVKKPNALAAYDWKIELS